MLSLPISSGTFRRSFLGGDGDLQISSDGDVWKKLVENGLRFEKDPGKVDQVADLKVGVNSAKTLDLGDKAGFNLAVSGGAEAVHQIQLIWPNGGNEALEDYELAFEEGQEQVYLRLLLSGRGNVSAAGGFQAPAGVKVKFGVEAGGGVAFEFLKRCDATERADKLIRGLFEGVILPQQLNTAEAVASIPAAGDLVITRLSGYLGLSAGLTWGYSLTGSKSLDIRDLALDLDYAVKLAASVSVGYRLAGDFEVQARRGSGDGWVRFTVRKSRQSEFNFAADLGLEGKFDLNGLPASADDFITKLAGADAEGVLRGLEKARKLSTLEALEAEVNRLARTAIDDLAMKWLDRALDNDSVEEFFGIIGRVVAEYDGIDKRIIQIYEDYLGRIPQLTETLRLLSTIEDPDSLKQLFGKTGVAINGRAWDLTKLVWGEGLYDLLLRQEEFSRFQSFVQEANNFLQDDAKARVRDFIATVKKTLQLEPLFGKLRQIDSPEKLRNLADQKLKGLAELLVGRAFDELKGTDFDKALKELHKTLEGIEKFKEQWYAKLRAAASQNFTLELSYAYSRASTRQALLDVEINLADPSGPELASHASKGDFAKLLQGYTSAAVRIHRGVLTHNLTKSAQLQVNVLGWSFDRLVKVVQNSEHSIEAQPGGLLHVFTSAVSIEQRKTIQDRDKFKETVASRFLLKTAAASIQPEGDAAAAIDPRTKSYLMHTLRSMAVDYDLTYEDERTKAEELTLYLQFARLMGLLPHLADGTDAVAALARQLNEQFPKGLGKVSVKSVVRYDDQSVRNAFLFSGDTLRALAQETMRAFIAARFTGMSQRDWAARIGFAYQSQKLADASRNNELVNKPWSVTLPPWFTRSAPQKVELTQPIKQVLDSLFRMEKRYLDRLVAFDQLIDQVQKEKTAVPRDELEKASREFGEMADDLDKWRENAFFAVFDRLVQVGSGGKGRRDSVMILEIQPPGSEIIRKILTSAPSAADG